MKTFHLYFYLIDNHYISPWKWDSSSTLWMMTLCGFTSVYGGSYQLNQSGHKWKKELNNLLVFYLNKTNTLLSLRLNRTTMRNGVGRAVFCYVWRLSLCFLEQKIENETFVQKGHLWINTWLNTLKHLFMLDHWSNAHRKWDPLLLCGGRNAIIETMCVVETSSAKLSLCVCQCAHPIPLFPNLIALLAYVRVSSTSPRRLTWNPLLYWSCNYSTCCLGAFWAAA